MLIRRTWVHGGLYELAREGLIALLVCLDRTVNELTARVEQLDRENAELRAKLSGGSGAPPWVKANRPKKGKTPRKKRAKSCHVE